MSSQGLRFRRVACPVCGGKRHALRYADELAGDAPPVDYGFSTETRRTFAIVGCSDCGHLFTNPMPSMASAYEESEDQVYLASLPQRRRTARRTLEAIRRHVATGRLLDVGCATGAFLDEAAASFEVEGIELSAWASARAAARHTVHRTPLAQFESPHRFDVITLFGVIEHFEDPHAEIAACARLLKPGGLIVIYTGDVQAWLPRLLGKRWWWYQGMHLQYFSRNTLERLLARSGITATAAQTYAVDFQLFSLASSLRRYALGRIPARLLELPGVRNVMVPLRLSGELLLFGRKGRE